MSGKRKKGTKSKIIDTKHKNPYKKSYTSGICAGGTERKTILSTVRKPEVVIGSYAFNRQVKYPMYQKRPFTDIDIKSDNKRKSALDIEQALDNQADQNRYYVSTLEHNEGSSYRVHNRSNKKIVADVGDLDKPVPHTVIEKVPFETLAHRKKEINKMLNQPSRAYRRKKDTRMMGYIKRYEEFLKHEKMR